MIRVFRYVTDCFGVRHWKWYTLSKWMAPVAATAVIGCGGVAAHKWLHRDTEPLVREIPRGAILPPVAFLPRAEDYVPGGFVPGGFVPGGEVYGPGGFIPASGGGTGVWAPLGPGLSSPEVYERARFPKRPGTKPAPHGVVPGIMSVAYQPPTHDYDVPVTGSPPNDVPSILPPTVVDLIPTPPAVPAPEPNAPFVLAVLSLLLLRRARV